MKFVGREPFFLYEEREVVGDLSSGWKFSGVRVNREFTTRPAGSVGTSAGNPSTSDTTMRAPGIGSANRVRISAIGAVVPAGWALLSLGLGVAALAVNVGTKPIAILAAGVWP